ncbi:MAG: NUDIX domain-containing protein [Cytophagia bacterium]|nr:NUDIX domain-containing protein [Cytophagia bacterium]NBW39004.1 NUDIX domain-containing protein [Cytophagia bacterium]
MDKELEQVYGHRLRVRVCGLCWQEDRLLLLDHQHLGTEHFWAPPGGGVDYEAGAEDCLVKEFQEETGLHVKVGDFLFATEFIKPPLHAIELFFEVHIKSGNLRLGHDPETKLNILRSVAFKHYEEILAMPPNHRHGVFEMARSPFELRKLRGYRRLL